MSELEVKYCQKCGNQNPIDQKFCGNCGFSFEGKPVATEVTSTVEKTTEEKTGIAMGIVSLVLSIFGLSCFPLLGSIIAVILGFLTTDRKNNKMAKAGIIIGFVGIALGLFGVCILIWWLIA